MKIVCSRFGGRFWLVNNNGERKTNKFKFSEFRYEKIGAFFRIKKRGSSYSVIINEYTEDIVCSGRHITFGNPIGDIINVLTSNMNLYFDIEGHLISDSIRVKFSNNEFKLHPAAENGKWGYVDNNLNWVLAPTFYEASNFKRNGFAIVSYDNKFENIINTGFQELLKGREYEKLEFIDDRNILFRNGKTSKKGVVTIDGEEIIPSFYRNIVKKGNYFQVENLSNGAIKYGLIDLNGNTIFECIYPELIETPDKFVVRDFEKKEVTKILECNK